METIEGFELSPQQKRLWQLQQSGSNLPYRSRCTVKLGGRIEPSILKNAIAKVISDHEILRTTFNSVSGMTLPLQVISADTSFNFSQYDYRGIGSETQLSKIEFLWEEYDRLSCDLSQNSLFHCALLALAESESLLLLDLPALYVDRQGLNNLVRAISKSYHGYIRGVADREIEAEILQYADISEWQNQLLNDEEQELILAKGYWRKQNIIDCLGIKLPLEKQLERGMGFEPRHLQFTFPTSQADRIAEFSEREKVPIEIFFLACWQILLWRITQQSDVLVGVSFDGRKYEELTDSIGLLARYLPLKSSFQENLLFSDIVKQIQLKVDDLNTWQEQFTWDTVLEGYATYLNGAFIPFSFDFTNLNFYSRDDIFFDFIWQESHIDKFTVKLDIIREGQNLTAKIHYDSRLLEKDYIQSLGEQFQTLISNILDSPDTAIDKLGLISDRDRHKILVEFNNTDSDYPKDKCIHQLFEEQVVKTPDAIAIVFEAEKLTYQQLNQQANQLARYLQSFGVKPEALVGICVERSLEMIIGLLGILKAGAAYVPLDPSYPEERLSYMLVDSGVGVLLTQQKLLSALPSNNARVICLDSNWKEIESQNRENLNLELTSNNLVYGIYTSGSTGKPKGVTIPHRALVNHMSWMQQTFPLTEKDKVLQKTPFSFDVSNSEFYAALLVGAQLIIAKPGGHQDGDYLIRAIAQQGVTVLQLVPSLLRILLNTGNLGRCQSLRQVFCGGEALSVELFNSFQRQSQANLHNLYGPTEACINTNFYSCHPGIRQKIVPIGRPLANTQTYILDPSLQPVPIGVAGELHIGGDGLATGYLNRPDLTAEKFIPNPFVETYHGTSLQQCPRLYKTGDLARYLPDGNIEFLGRIDRQVKLRGLRIELGEVESILNSHPQIQQAVVIVSDDGLERQSLIAYIVVSDKSLIISQLREFLRQKLPEYTIPSAFVTLDVLPLMPNGKIDRKALPAPKGVIAREREYIAPRTPSEEITAEIFASILGVENVGIHDSFFELGGHSLLATQAVSRINQTFSIELPLRRIFETPTVAEVAEIVLELQVLNIEDEEILNLLAD